MTAPYSILARFYDRLMEDVDYGAWCDFYLSCLDKYGVSGKHILDLACGTGSITVPLAERGFTVTGIDLSAEMLALAQKKADEAGVHVRFSEQNIAGFESGGEVDAVICSFDGINYLTSAKDAAACFARIYNTLADGGLFLFDVGTPYHYRRILADNTYTYDYEDLFVSWQNDFHPKSGLCNFYLTFFVRENGFWHRYDEIQRQRAYPLPRLDIMLKNACFTVLEKVGDLDFSPLSAESERCFYLCRKNNQ